MRSPPPAAINLTIPLTTLPGLTDHPGEAAAFGPLDAGLARDIATHAAASPATTWCLTVTDEHGHPTAHGCAKPALPGRTRDLTAALEPLAVTECDHRHQTTAHDPGRLLRHLTEIRDGACTYPPCLRDARRCDFEHAIPRDQGGRTCACNAGPRCRHHHHLKQSAGWTLEQNQPGYHTWTTPASRRYTTGPTTYPT